MKRTPEQEDARMVALLLEHGDLRRFRPVTCGAWPIRKGDEVELDWHGDAVPSSPMYSYGRGMSSGDARALEDAESGQQLYVEMHTGGARPWPPPSSHFTGDGRRRR